MAKVEIESFRWMEGISECEKTVFNYVTVMNNYEAEFAQALDSFSDVKAFSALAETFTQFFVNYPKPNGAIGRYYPDWVVKYDGPEGIEYWIIETNGREFPGVEEKDKSMALWCEKVSKQESTQWNYTRVNQDWWKTVEIKSFKQLLADNPFTLEK